MPRRSLPDAATPAEPPLDFIERAVSGDDRAGHLDRRGGDHAVEGITVRPVHSARQHRHRRRARCDGAALRAQKMRQAFDDVAHLRPFAEAVLPGDLMEAARSHEHRLRRLDRLAGEVAQRRRGEQRPDPGVRVQKDDRHSHDLRSSSAMRSRKSGQRATTPSAMPIRNAPSGAAGTMRATGTPPRAITTSSPRSTAATSSEMRLQRQPRVMSANRVGVERRRVIPYKKSFEG